MPAMNQGTKRPLDSSSGTSSPPSKRRDTGSQSPPPGLVQLLPPSPPPSSTASQAETKGQILLAWRSRQAPSTHDPVEYHGLGKKRSSWLFNPDWRNAAGKTPDAERALERKASKEEQKVWLDSGKDWGNRIGEGWVGKRVLGVGAYGIAGLWELEGGKEKNVGDVTQVVVKQAGGAKKYVDCLEREGNFLEEFAKRKARYIVRMYKRISVEDGGQGTVPGMDGKDKTVARIFLEYCEGGDFGDSIKEIYRLYTPKGPLPEVMIWRIFRCLALGLAMIENGNEELDGASWDREIDHFDIKPENIFVGNAAFNEFLTMPVVKIADFGLALEVPSDQDEYYLRENKHRGTPHFLTPEQFDPDSLLSLRYSTSTNTWQTGKVIYQLLCRGRSFQNTSTDPYYIEFSPGSRGLTYGTHILDAPYSVLLRTIVLRCLAQEPRMRPRARDLVRIIDEGIRACEEVVIGIQSLTVSKAGAGEV